MDTQRRVAVIGGGAWGTALAVHLSRMGERVHLWMREADLVERMLERRDNPAYLPGVRIPESVSPHSRIAEAARDAGLIVTAVPSQFARVVYGELARAAEPDVACVVCTKGIEEHSLALPLEVARSELGDRPLAVLSGPSFAAEVAHGLPTAVVVAADDPELAETLQRRLSSRELRVYTNRDAVGVQLTGALKNVVAIAVGAAESLGLGTNARAGLITRGLAEMTRLVVACGGRASTASGLAGLGDLVLTCTGDLSRNRRFGRRLGHGERPQDILAESRSVAEGVRTARGAQALARRFQVEMPIVDEVCRILYEDSSAEDCLERLLSRPLRSEVPDRAP